jgi:hypothetical protein
LTPVLEVLFGYLGVDRGSQWTHMPGSVFSAYPACLDCNAVLTGQDVY